MNAFEATVRLAGNTAAVRLGQATFTVSPREGTGTSGGCPVAYLAAALGS